MEDKEHNMKISYAITVCNELDEIKRLVPYLLKNKRIEDEIVVLYDEKNGNPEVLEYLLTFNKLPNVQTWRGFDWNNNFADWKNKLNDYCSGDYIFQIDADEMINEYLLKNISQIISLNPKIDLYFIPRINTVEGITDEHIKMWGWKVNDKGWVNFPDYQGRLYKKGMSWYGKVHERIIGGQNFTSFPLDEEYCLLHPKTIQRQEKQNNFYKSI
jgi:glycosyltransferase involved in cell wall biosynthesis